MKKIIVLLAVLALCAGSAMAVVVSGDAAVNLTITKFAAIGPDGDWNIPLDNGWGFWTPHTFTFTVSANFAGAAEFTWAQGTLPGTWTKVDGVTAFDGGGGDLVTTTITPAVDPWTASGSYSGLLTCTVTWTP